MFVVLILERNSATIHNFLSCCSASFVFSTSTTLRLSPKNKSAHRQILRKISSTNRWFLLPIKNTKHRRQRHTYILVCTAAAQALQRQQKYLLANNIRRTQKIISRFCAMSMPVNTSNFLFVFSSHRMCSLYLLLSKNRGFFLFGLFGCLCVWPISFRSVLNALGEHSLVK